MEIKLKDKTEHQAFELLSKLSLHQGYWRKEGERELLRKLRLNGLVQAISGYNPQFYKCHGQCFFKLTPLGASFVEQHNNLQEVC